MRRKRKILVPLNLGGGTWQLGIDLAVMKLQVGADQVGDTVGHRAVTHDVVILVRYVGRRIDTTQRWPVGAMAGLDIKAGSVIDGFAIRRLLRTTLLDPSLEPLAQRVKLRIADCIFDDQVSLVCKEPFLLRA